MSAAGASCSTNLQPPSNGAAGLLLLRGGRGVLFVHTASGTACLAVGDPLTQTSHAAQVAPRQLFINKNSSVSPMATGPRCACTPGGRCPTQPHFGGLALAAPMSPLCPQIGAHIMSSGGRSVGGGGGMEPHGLRRLPGGAGRYVEIPTFRGVPKAVPRPGDPMTARSLLASRLLVPGRERRVKGSH